MISSSPKSSARISKSTNLEAMTSTSPGPIVPSTWETSSFYQGSCQSCSDRSCVRVCHHDALMHSGATGNTDSVSCSMWARRGATESEMYTETLWELRLLQNTHSEIQDFILSTACRVPVVTDAIQITTIRLANAVHPDTVITWWKIPSHGRKIKIKIKLHKTANWGVITWQIVHEAISQSVRDKPRGSYSDTYTNQRIFTVYNMFCVIPVYV